MQSKVQLETSLEAARTLVKAYFEADDCPWEKRFHIEQQKCRQCADADVCEWLLQHDPRPDLSACPAGQMRNALTFAVGYLEGQMHQADHETDDCPCAVCVWVRATHALL
jgi:hypothetical protein